MIARKTAVVGASSLAGHELVQRLRAREVPLGELVLSDPGSESAVLSAVEGELVVATPLVDEALDGADLVLACVPLQAEDAARVRSTASRATVLDLCGSLEAPVVDRWGSATLETLGKGAHSVPAAGAVLVAALGRSAREAGAEGLLVATCFEPASEMGRAALDELFAQALAMLNFSSMPAAVLGRQFVHDLHSPGYQGPSAETRLRREATALLGGPQLSLVIVSPGVFHGVAVAMRAAAPPDAWRAAIERGGRLEVSLGDEDASPAATARSERAIVGRVESDGVGGAWAWAAADSLAFGAVGGAVELLSRSARGSGGRQ